MTLLPLLMVQIATNCLASQERPFRYMLTPTFVEESTPEINGPIIAFHPTSDLFDHVARCRVHPDWVFASDVYIWDDRRNLDEQLNLRDIIVFARAMDVTGDGLDELLLGCRGDTAATLYIYTGSSPRLLSTFSILERDWRHRPRPAWETWIDAGLVVNGVIEDRPALLARTGNGYGHWPRGLVLIDPLHGTELWHYWMATDPAYLTTGDVNGDGTAEIIFGTRSSGNGAVWEDMNDSQCHVGVLTLDGRQLWRNTYPGEFTSMAVSTRQSENHLGVDVVGFFAGDNESGGPECWYLFNGQTGEMISQRVFPKPVQDRYMLSWPTHDGGTRFLVGTKLRGSLLFDEAFRLLKFTPNITIPQALYDIDSDGTPEIAGYDELEHPVLLDNRLNLLIRSDFTAQSVVFQRNRESRWPYLWVAGGGSVKRLDLRQNPSYTRDLALYWLRVYSPYLVGAAIGVFAVGVIMLRNRMRERSRKVKDEAERNRQWSMRMSQLAHDIRTPLNVLRLNAQNLEEELRVRLGGIPADLEDYFSMFGKQAERLRVFADGLVDDARFTPPNKQLLDLEQLVRETVERIPQSATISIIVTCAEKLPKVEFDPEQISSAIENAILNSMQAMLDGGTVEITIGRAHHLPDESSDRSVFVAIKDTGCGIPATQLSRVFDRYFTTKLSGKGLGLALVREHVQAHGGTVSIKSVVNQGTELTITLPETK